MYQPVSSLSLPDFKVQDLLTRGYYYTKDVDVSKNNTNSKEWDNITQVPETKTALDIYQEECILGSISTFNKHLDDILGGGISMGLITEFCGESGSGKTQICFQCCVNVQLPKWCGGTEGEAVYITTNKGFASHRLREIATTNVNNYKLFKNNNFNDTKAIGNEDFNVESILQRIHCINVDDYLQLIAAVKRFEQWLEVHSNIKLIVIDSISAPLRLLEGQERTPIIYTLLSDLQELAQKYKFAIVLTNDMTTRVLPTNLAYHTPSLGGSYYHRINVRIQLKKICDTKFKASLVKHTFMPLNEIVFTFPC